MTMSLTLQQLEKQLSKNEVYPFYFIGGPELFLIRESLKKIQNCVLSPESLDFNYQVFHIGKVEIDRVCEALETLPVLSTKRMIVCESAHLLTESEWKILQPIMNKSVDNCILVFVSEVLDKRKK